MEEVTKEKINRARNHYFYVIAIGISVVLLIIITIFKLISGTKFIDILDNLILIAGATYYVFTFLPNARDKYKKLVKTR